MLEPKPTLLVVDDDEVYRQRLAKALAARGFEVLTAQDAESAVALAQADSPEYAILDLRMPGASGLELLRRLKAIDPGTQVLMLTGYGSIRTAVEAMQVGSVQYLTKPVDVDEILAAFQGQSPVAPEDDTPSLARVEWEHIQRVLHDCDGNLSEAARRLGMHRRSLQRKAARNPPGK